MTSSAPQPPGRRRVPGFDAVRSLSRRVRALLAAAVLFLILFILALTLPVPYVVLSPGPTFNTLGSDDQGRTIIVIDGRKTNPTSGHLNMTTVNVSTQPISAFTALSGWLLHDKVVVPKSSVYPPGKTQKQVTKQNFADFAQSQDSAIAAAACELGYPQAFGVIGVLADGPAHGKLEPGDQLISVDGRPAGSYDKLAATLKKHQAGDRVDVAVKRSGTVRHVPVTLSAPPSGSSVPRLGITVSTTCLAPFEVEFEGLVHEIGGPSAGMMFALGIIDKVGPYNLTGGKFIAGTGTITPDGQVGPIGGIPLKMIAARNKGATIFLAPAGNCDEVRKSTPDGLDVVKVSTLHQAVRDLIDLRRGKPVPHC